MTWVCCPDPAEARRSAEQGRRRRQQRTAACRVSIADVGPARGRERSDLLSRHRALGAAQLAGMLLAAVVLAACASAPKTDLPSAAVAADPTPATAVTPITAAVTATVGSPSATNGSHPGHSVEHPRATASHESVDPGAAAAAAGLESLLATRSEAIARRDRRSWHLTIRQGAADASAELEAFDSIVRLGVRSLDFETPTELTRLSAGGAEEPAAATLWQANVIAVYRLPDADRGDRRARRTVTFIGDHTGWHIVRWLGAADRWEIWDLAGVSSAGTHRVLVVGNAPLQTLVDRAAETDVLLGRVTDVLGRAPRIVVVIAQSAEEASRMAGWAAAAVDRVAASTIGDRATGRPADADRVVLNPQAWARLTPTGRLVVLTHEIVHVVLRATTTHDVPMWLSEGIAEWMAYRDSALDPRDVARTPLLDHVRAQGAPADLPGEADFDTSRPTVARSYQASWLAVRQIARDQGTARLLGFYRRIAIPGSTWPTSASVADLDSRVEVAFVEELGLTRRQFLGRWAAELVALARG